MATMQGITGGLSGKMGSAVFRQRGGQTIASQYQPIVKNPNSEGQQIQRAKFKLMSQLAAIMSSGFGTMAVTKRKSAGQPSQRNMFTKLNFPLVDVTTEETGVVAKIPMEQLQLTSSFRHLPPLALGGSTGEIVVDFNDEPSADIASVRLVLVGYPGNVAAVQEIVDVPRDTIIAEPYSFTGLEAGNYTVLAYGIIPSASAASSIDLDNIHTPADENFISAVELDAMVSNGLIAETKTVGANVAVL